MSTTATPIVPRCGDTVLHRPTGETWGVAYADQETDTLSWCGWPDGCAKLSDCDLVERCSDEKHADSVAMWLDEPHGTDGGRGDERVHHVRRLYRPKELAAMQRAEIGRACIALAERLSNLKPHLLDDAFKAGRASELSMNLLSDLRGFARVYGGLSFAECHPTLTSGVAVPAERDAAGGVA